jgi:hypothetical protein
MQYYTCITILHAGAMALARELASCAYLLIHNKASNRFVFALPITND